MKKIKDKAMKLRLDIRKARHERLRKYERHLNKVSENHPGKGQAKVNVYRQWLIRKFWRAKRSMSTLAKKYWEERAKKRAEKADKYEPYEPTELKVGKSVTGTKLK